MSRWPRISKNPCAASSTMSSSGTRTGSVGRKSMMFWKIPPRNPPVALAGVKSSVVSALVRLSPSRSRLSRNWVSALSRPVTRSIPDEITTPSWLR